MLFILWLLIGYLLSWVFGKDLPPVERVAFSLLGGLIAVPFAAIHLSLFGGFYLSSTLLAILTAAFLVPLSKPALTVWRRRRIEWPDRRGWIALGLTGAVAVFAYFYYTNAEFLLSLGSYLRRGEAKCFYMQAFRLIGELNPGGARPPLADIYNIISTPGNLLFTAPFIPLFGPAAFRWVYVAVQALLFLWVFLLAARLTQRTWLAAATALFAVFNPYLLSVEVLDRNVIALALSAALLHLALAHPTRAFWHGLLLGVTAGTGLRFLPLTLVFPLLAIYAAGRAPRKSYLLLFAGAAGSFAFNIPHLFFHGFHSLGETQPFTALLLATFGRFAHTPFLPYPNIVFYPALVLGFLGVATTALMLLGAGRVWAQHRLLFMALLLAFLPTLLVLAVQRDWIEGDKYRILLSAFLAPILFFGGGLEAILSPDRLRRSLACLAVLFVGLATGAYFLPRLATPADPSMNARKPIYQSETPVYTAFYRRHFTNIPALPNYRRLFRKIDFRAKRIEETIIARTLFFAADGKPATQNTLIDRWFRRIKPLPPPTPNGGFANLEIDFEKLVADTGQAARIVADAANYFIDFSNPRDLLDVYYREFDVSWQPETLPVIVLTESLDRLYKNELYLDLNAFIGLGKDEYGFEKVNQINFYSSPEKREHARQTGLTALPQTDRANRVTLRVPLGLRLVVRNWIVDGVKGTPHRIDSWEIELEANGEARTRFFVGEPESYL